MLTLIAHHLGMLVALWIVLILTGVNLVVQVIKGLTGPGSWQEMANAATHPLLYHILPLILLAGLTTLDPTHFLILIWYYLAALLIVVVDLLNLSQYIKR
jgi:cytochrome b561